MPDDITDDITDVPVYLDSVNRIFHEYSVPNEIRGHLLNPFLSKAARKFVVTFPINKYLLASIA